MSTKAKEQWATREGSASAGAEQRLKELGVELPAPPEPFGTYVEAVQTGNLLFLTGMLPTEGRAAKFVGRVGAELDIEAGRKAAHLAALNVLAVARRHLGSLDKVTRIVRLGVSVAASGDFREQPKVADAASELLVIMDEPTQVRSAVPWKIKRPTSISRCADYAVSRWRQTAQSRKRKESWSNE